MNETIACPNCGRENEAVTPYCARCGDPLGLVVATSSQSVSTFLIWKDPDEFRLRLGTSDILIGRTKRADLRIKRPGVARRHALIFLLDGRYVIEDLSTPAGPGVLIRGLRVPKRQTLRAGDLIQCGGVEIRLEQQVQQQQQQQSNQIALHSRETASMTAYRPNRGVSYLGPGLFVEEVERPTGDVPGAAIDPRSPRDHAAPRERKINAWIPDDRPPRVGETCFLYLRVGQRVAGDLVAGRADISDADVPEGGLPTRWIVTSSDVEIIDGAPAVTIKADAGAARWSARFPVLIPKTGPGHDIKLRIRPRVLPASIDVLVLVDNDIYREVGIELRRRPDVAADVVHAPMADVRRPRIHEWTTPPGTLTIRVSHDRAIVLGNVAGTTRDYETEWYGAPPRVAGRLDALRTAAERFRARHEAYLNDLDPAELDARLAAMSASREFPRWDQLDTQADANHQDAWHQVSTCAELQKLAYDGYLAYSSLFPESNRLRQDLEALAPGHRLNISWMAGMNANWMGIPWGLLYMRPPDPTQPVDPLNFLALRFRIAYTKHDPTGTEMYLGRTSVAHVGHGLYWDPADAAGQEAIRHRAEWRAIENQRFAPVTEGGAAPNSRQELLDLLRAPRPTPMRVLYFFCRCALHEGGQPVLMFSGAADGRLVLQDIGLVPLADRPLVFANACTTVDNDPYYANELEQHFFQRRCSAYIGTESKVPIGLASRFAAVFFRFFFRRVDAAPIAAGEALSQTRLFLWTRFLNLGGIFYSQVNQYDLYLADRAEVVHP
jgi:hypothetical protein